MAFPKIGNLAPAFTLPDQDGEPVSLADFRDHKNVILYFYPKAMTPGCTVQACGLRDARARYTRAGTEILGISPDTPARLAKFREKEKLNFTLLSDPEHKIAAKYGVWGKKKFMGREFMGVHRVSFIIGADGRLKHIMEKVNTKTHHEDALQWLKQNLE
ncbi:MAG: thioredoxin-dependent thiol peroxidase [Gammaproteobacteria bacterium]|jgi:peroxiredoxin Q/BCP|nr:thioredoxin-dependent thiol peroxidase [Gammaproteobacteria bacterium]